MMWRPFAIRAYCEMSLKRDLFFFHQFFGQNPFQARYRAVRILD